MRLTKITDLTGRMDISSRTLRYYEQTGLLQSVRPDFEQCRYFDDENIERLKQILVLRKMQIPIKDIIRIYESRDTSVVVETFVRRIREIDEQVRALSELKAIVNEFLQTMRQKGIVKISALPLLYEEMDRQLELRKGPVPYEQLEAVSEALAGPVDVSIVDLPPMRMLSSVSRQSGASDAEGFWDWMNQKGVPIGMPGRHALFEVQNDARQTVILQKVEESFVNDGPYALEQFEGGLFAVGSVHVDEDVAAFYRGVLRSFDENPYYEVDYRHDGRLRHEALVESVLSPDGRREKVNIFVPVKTRLPDASLYDPNEQVEDITVREIERANPVLWEKSVAMDALEPILRPHYRVTEAGEAEYIAYIDKRRLSTRIEVKLPFRVDIEFRVDETSARFGYGSDEGSVRFFHGTNLYGVNMHNNPDERLSQEAVSFHQPIFGDYFSYPKKGRIDPGVYNALTWIVGQRHFAVILNGQVRYCGVNFPYMAADLRLQQAHPIVLGSNGQGKRYFRSIRVSQLKQAPIVKLKGGALSVRTRQSNNTIPVLHQLITMHYGENYWFNGCAKYVMECLGETDYDYSFFAGVTGDNLAQVYAYDRFRGDGATDYVLSDAGTTRFIEDVFGRCGYASAFVTEKNMKAGREGVRQRLIESIDRGVPVIRCQWGWGVFVGYEEYGKILLYMSSDKTEPERVAFEDALPEEATEAQETRCGWIFVGEKKRQADLRQIYRDTIVNLPQLLTARTEGYCFGPEAFRAWAADIEGGRFDGMKPEAFEGWVMYKIYVCNLATNSGCCQSFLEKAQALNPDFAFLEEVRKLYRQTGRLWNDQKGEDLEALGGGFNITLAALQDPARRARIVAKIREFAACMDAVLEILREHLNQ